MPQEPLSAVDDDDDTNVSADAPLSETTPSPSSTHRLTENAAEDILRRLAPDRPAVVQVWRRTLNRLFPLGGTSVGNTVELYFDGDAAFTDMLAAIDRAKQRVWLETYIIEDDALGQRVRDALVRARRRGVEVRVLFDAYGSMTLPSDFFDDLSSAGGFVVAFNPLLPFHFSRSYAKKKENPWPVRDHRKILVVDDDVAFCGGMNISCDYAGKALGNGLFRDTHLKLQGPAVGDLAFIFASSLHQATEGPDLRASAASGASLASSSTEGSDDDVAPLQMPGVLVQVLTSNVGRGRRQIQRSLRQSVGRSMETCYLTSPYFVPPRRLVRALTLAARRGVDVRVLTAGQSDVPVSKWASEAVYARLVKRGVRIYEMNSQTLHAKTASIDGLYSMVGSFNLDMWSYRRNLEVSLAMVNVELTEALDAQFEKDLAGAQEVHLADLKKRSVMRRALSWLSYQVLRW